jgi:hypothetical protein
MLLLTWYLLVAPAPQRVALPLARCNQSSVITSPWISGRMFQSSETNSNTPWALHYTLSRSGETLIFHAPYIGPAPLLADFDADLPNA